MEFLMIQKRKVRSRRISNTERFNKDPKTSDFLNKFQKIMIQRLDLNHINKYHKDNIEQIMKSTINQKYSAINTKIDGGFTLSCNVEPELYIEIQDVAKKITGDYMSMDELIHLLLTYFVHTYRNYLPKTA